MAPILLIHGYSSEGKESTVEEIYGSLPNDLRRLFGTENILELNLSRWISLNDGIRLDDVSFAMQRALSELYPNLLSASFHVIIHSTGALVVRNWIKQFSPRPSPIKNLIHLAGANFGSGLAHIGKGQLARWGRMIFQGTGRGNQILTELEFGSWKTLDLQLHFLLPKNNMLDDYQVQEFCIIGSRTLDLLQVVPIRYVKEDSADNTVRTSACNLNFNYIPVTAVETCSKLEIEDLQELVNKRLDNKSFVDQCYDYDLSMLGRNRPEVPFAVAFETAHFGEGIGIVSGKENRNEILPLIRIALETPFSSAAYQETVAIFKAASKLTFERAAKLPSTILKWDQQAQYAGHTQLIFRLRDQFGNAVTYFDITFKSVATQPEQTSLEEMIEDKHENGTNKGTTTYYLRTQKFNNKTNAWDNLLDQIPPVKIEITGHEPLSSNIAYVPMNLQLNQAEVKAIVEPFKTTIVDITLMRLPSDAVFKLFSG